MTFLGRNVAALQCFVCDEGLQSLSCDNFNSNNYTYAKDCPPNASGSCSITIVRSKLSFQLLQSILQIFSIVDQIISRACESHRLHDCKMANAVEYCFCTSDLCNGDKHKYIGPLDDEDFTEGSGLKVTPTSVFTEEQPSVRITIHATAVFVEANIYVIFICLLQYFMKLTVL